MSRVINPDTDGRVRYRAGAICTVEACGKRRFKRSFCNKHYLLWYRHKRLHNLIGAKGTGSLRKDGYRVITVDGREILEHVHIAEKALGKHLPKGAVVHHVNEVRSDNTPTNLVVCPNNAYHYLLHRRMRAQKLNEYLSEFGIAPMELPL
jgi:hypothetical protein